METTNTQNLVALSHKMDSLIENLVLCESLGCEQSIEVATIELEHLRGDAACTLGVTPESFMEAFWERYNKSI